MMYEGRSAVCDSKKPKFNKKEETEKLLRMIGKILVLGPLI